MKPFNEKVEGDEEPDQGSMYELVREQPSVSKPGYVACSRCNVAKPTDGSGTHHCEQCGDLI